MTGVAETAASRGAAERLGHLRRLRMLEGALIGVVAAPFALLAPMFMTVDHFGDDPSGILVEILISLGCVLVFSLPIGALVMQEWAAWSYAYRRSPDLRRPIDWNSGWSQVRRVMEQSGMDLDRVLAFSTFRTHENLETWHRPRRSLGVLGAMSDWGVEHNRKLIAGGAAGGVGLAVADNAWPGWYDRPAFWVVLGAVFVAVLPLAVWNGWSQYRLNVRRPESIVVIPTQWCARLRDRNREDRSTATAVFLHEVSHVRHHDAARRRFVRAYARVAQFLAFLDSGLVFAVRLPAGVALALFAVVAGCGIVGVRTASRGLLLVEELRADVEATPDDEARESLRAFLAGVLERRPTRQLAVRVRVLGSRSALTGLRTPLRALATSVLGFALPLMGIFVLVWSGVLDVAPDF